MKIYDKVNKVEVEVDGTKGLIQQMKDGRQVDLYLKEKKSDEDGYMSWDVEHWSSVDERDSSAAILWKAGCSVNLQGTTSMTWRMILSRKKRRK